MASTHVLFWEVSALHEPQKVAQASCLFGADRLEACPTLQPAARFMASTHVPQWGRGRPACPTVALAKAEGRLRGISDAVHGVNARAKRKGGLPMNLTLVGTSR